MSEKNLETRVTQLEQELSAARETSAAMFGMAKALIELQKATATQLFKWMVALDTRNNEALETVKAALPDQEKRQKLSDILARSVFDRDQLEAMIRKIESLRPPGP